MDDLDRLLDGGHAADGATETLHSIQAGGQNLLIVARRRIGECLDEIDRGDFKAAASTAQTVMAVLNPLAHAQSYLAVADSSQMVRARDLRAGMKLSDVGEITDVAVTECGVERCNGHVTIKLGEHEIEYDGAIELYVEAASIADE